MFKVRFVVKSSVFRVRVSIKCLVFRAKVKGFGLWGLQLALWLCV